MLAPRLAAAHLGPRFVSVQVEALLHVFVGPQAKAFEGHEQLLKAFVGVRSRQTFAVRFSKTDQFWHHNRGLLSLGGHLQHSCCPTQRRLSRLTLRTDEPAIVAGVSRTLQ